jgi:hypothetical protein
LSSGRLIVDGVIQNVTVDTIKSPVKLRIIGLQATSGGRAKVVNANNGVEGIGAVWDFSDFLVERQLKPGEKSKGRPLEFHVSGSPPLTAERLTTDGWRAVQLIHLEARVLGKVEKSVSVKD